MVATRNRPRGNSQRFLSDQRIRERRKLKYAGITTCSVLKKALVFHLSPILGRQALRGLSCTP